MQQPVKRGEPIHILYYGSCWPTNIGNAFVNVGAINALHQACGAAASVHHFGGMSSYLFKVHGRPDHTLLLGDWAKFDYVVTGGMTQCEEHLEAAARNLGRFLDDGAQLVIAGGGGLRYDADEVEAVRRWMQRLPISVFISRDRHAYESYGDLAPHSHDGIDSAFFISDGFDPLPLADDYIVLNFDTRPEPEVEHCPATDAADPDLAKPDSTTRPGFRARVGQLLGSVESAASTAPRPPPIDAHARRVIRTHHAPMLTRDSDFLAPNTLISDLPSDYLSLYAQAAEVHSDRVHACIATLSFGNRAQFYVPREPRLRMFKRLGAERIIHEPVRVDSDHLHREKTAQVEFLREALLKPAS
jgi:hypothetical protein